MANFTIPGAQALTEDLSFFKGLIVGCGEASALVIAHIIKGTPLSPGQLTNLIQSAANANQLSGAGFGQTAKNVQWDLSQFGIQSTISGFNASAIDASLSQGIPVEVGISNGGVLTGEPLGLRGHFITLVGKNDSGYIVADPNTAQSKSGGFVTDSLQQLQNANPFATVTPSGTGPNDSVAQCEANCGVNLFCKWQCSVGQTPGSPLGGIAGDIAGGIAGGLSTAGNNFLHTLGLSGAGDLFWRTGLIIGAVILFIIGLAAIIFDFLDKSNVEVAGTRV